MTGRRDTEDLSDGSTVAPLLDVHDHEVESEATVLPPHAGTLIQSVRTSDGVQARIESNGDGEVLRVSDRNGRLILEHRSADGVTVLCATGDLELRADSGSIRLVARDGIEMEASKARVAVQDVTVEATTITATADKMRQVIGLMETHAGRILERARNVYRDVEELSQTRAGRIKLVAEKTFSVLGLRTLFKAREDVKIKGEKIYLA